MASEPERSESIFGRTDTVFTTPKLNAGAPREPWPLRVLSSVEMGASVLLFIAIVFGVMYQVLGRYIPAISWIGSGELALLAMVSMTFLMIGYLAGRNGHVTIELFDQLLRGRRLFVALRVVSAVIMLLTCLALAYDAFAKIDAEWSRSSAAIGVPMGLLYVFAFVGGLSAGIHSAAKIPYAHRPERQLEISEMEG